MSLADLLRLGYLPQELPPCFVTDDFSIHAQTIYTHFNNSLWANITNKNPYKHSQLLKFSIPKVGIVRKNLAIPNPFHFYKLSDYLINNLQPISTHLNNSRISCSKPNVSIVGTERCFESDLKFHDFIEKCLEESVGNYYQIKTDISNYYSSIYTHSIPWGMAGKPIAKQNFLNARPTFGDEIDKFLRNCQENQTIGIPIGPDTSLLISEIIGARIDIEIQNRFPNVNGVENITENRPVEYHAKPAICERKILTVFSLN